MSHGFLMLVVREWAMTPLVIALAVLPGIGFAAVVARRIRLSWPEMIAASFAFSVAMASAVATVAYVARLHLDVVLAAYLAFIPISLWFFVREQRAGHLKKHGHEMPGLLLAAGAALVAMIERPWFRSGADTFYHLAATRSLLLTGRPLVTDPFHGTAENVLDPTSGVWHTVQAIMSRTLFTDISTLYMGVMALGAGIAVLCFWTLARRLAGENRAAVVATVVMAAVAYHLDFRVLAYPKHLSEALAFFGIALLVRLLEEPAWPVVGVAGLVGAATATMHLAAAEFLFLAGGFIVLALLCAHLMEYVRSRETAWRRPLLAVLAALGLTAALAVPVLLPRVRALSGSSVMGADSYLQLSSHVMWIGSLQLVKPGGMFNGGPIMFVAVLVMLAIAARPAFRDKQPRALAAVALLAMAPLLLNDPAFTPFALHYSSYMVSRMAALIRFLAFADLAWVLAYAWDRHRVALRRVGALLVVAALLTAVPDLVTTATGWHIPGTEKGLDVYGLGATWQKDYRAMWGVDTLAEIRKQFGTTYPVVAADPDMGYYFAGLEPAAIVATKISHSPAYIEGIDGPQRREDMRQFFNPGSSAAVRDAIVERYHIHYVLLSQQTRPNRKVRNQLLAQGAYRVAARSSSIVLLERIAP